MARQLGALFYFFLKKGKFIKIDNIEENIIKNSLKDNSGVIFLIIYYFLFNRLHIALNKTVILWTWLSDKRIALNNYEYNKQINFLYQKLLNLKIFLLPSSHLI